MLRENELWNQRQEEIRLEVEAENEAWMQVYNQSGGVRNQGAESQRIENITIDNTFMFKGIGLTVTQYSGGEFYQVAANYNGTLAGHTREVRDYIDLDPTPNCGQSFDRNWCQLWNEIKAEIRRKIANGSLTPVVI